MGNSACKCRIASGGPGPLPKLIAALGALAGERAATMMAGVTGPEAITRAELARHLGVSRKQVTDTVAVYGGQ